MAIKNVKKLLINFPFFTIFAEVNNSLLMILSFIIFREFNFITSM